MSNKVKYSFIILGLLILWALLLSAQIFLIEKSFTLLTHSYSKDIFYTGGNNSNNVKGNTLTAKFKSKEDYLGIVSISFDERQKMLDGQITFKLKEEGAPDWYYQNTYDARQLNDLSFYPFGFPIIESSQNKKYVVEVKLEEGNQSNKFLQLSPFGQTLSAHHKYPKGPMIEDNAVFSRFLYKKVLNIVENNYQIFASTIYLYPLLFFILLRIGKHKYTRMGFLALLVLTVCYDAIFVLQFVDLAYVTIAALWILLLRKLDYASTLSFQVGLSMLGLSILFQLLNNEKVVEKFASWAFMFITVAVIQSIIEIRKPGADTLN